MAADGGGVFHQRAVAGAMSQPYGVPLFAHAIALPSVAGFGFSRHEYRDYEIDPETLQGFLGLFEVPSEHEGAEVVVVQNFTEPGSTGANA